MTLWLDRTFVSIVGAIVDQSSRCTLYDIYLWLKSFWFVTHKNSRIIIVRLQFQILYNVTWPYLTSRLFLNWVNTLGWRRFIRFIIFLSFSIPLSFSESINNLIGFRNDKQRIVILLCLYEYHFFFLVGSSLSYTFFTLYIQRRRMRSGDQSKGSH